MIYLDNASTTKVFDEVNDLMYEINKNQYFNPSALYQNAIDTSNMLKDARIQIANNLNAKEENILFTSGATEGNNLAINGFATGKKDAEYIFALGEHPSVFNVANNLKMQNKIVKFVNLTKNGIVDVDELKSLLTENTHFVSIMHVSNETGAINDIKSLCKAVKDFNKKDKSFSDLIDSIIAISVLSLVKVPCIFSKMSLSPIISSVILLKV